VHKQQLPYYQKGSLTSHLYSCIQFTGLVLYSDTYSFQLHNYVINYMFQKLSASRWQCYKTEGVFVRFVLHEYYELKVLCSNLNEEKVQKYKISQTLYES